MSELRYVGKSEDPRDTLTAEAIMSRVISPVTTSNVSDAVEAYAGTSLLTSFDFAQKKNNYTSVSEIKERKSEYLQRQTVGAPNGPAPLDISGRLDPRNVYTTDNSRQWMLLQTVAGLPGASITSASGDAGEVRVITGFSVPYPGYKYFPIIFGSFSMSGTGGVFLRANGRVIARGVHSFADGRSGVNLQPANPVPVTGDLRIDLAVISRLDTDNGVTFASATVHSGGFVTIFAAPAPEA